MAIADFFFRPFSYALRLAHTVANLLTDIISYAYN